jgi:hypothetical protein
MDYVENCDCYINLLSSQTVYKHVFLASDPPGERAPCTH